MTEKERLNYKRQTGKTTRQLESCPPDTEYIVPWEHEVWFYQQLAAQLGRSDVHVSKARWRESRRGSKRPLIYDHSVISPAYVEDLHPYTDNVVSYLYPTTHQLALDYVKKDLCFYAPNHSIFNCKFSLEFNGFFWIYITIHPDIDLSKSIFLADPKPDIYFLPEPTDEELCAELRRLIHHND